VSEWRIPLCDLDFGPEELEAVERVVRSKWLSMGPEVRAFEDEFAKMQRSKHAIAVANATGGLHLALLALGIGPGDEVVQPALNFVAAANVTVATGASPVFADILSLQEPTIDPSNVEQLLTPRTKAVIVMHYGGNLCQMTKLMELGRRRGIPLIEDACHAVGAEYYNRRGDSPGLRMAGSIGDIGAFSFFANKNIATGEGGMLVTNRDDLAERLRLLRSHGMTTLTWDRHKGHAFSYDVLVNGYNYRLDELRAALGRVQLVKLSRQNERRRHLLARYDHHFAALPDWTVPFSRLRAQASGHLMVAVAPSPDARSKVVLKLREAGIQTSLHYPCIADFQAFAQHRCARLNRTREFARRAISLPIFPAMTESMVESVCRTVREADRVV
jgi:dTDP-4-amino-4,6-dideoxygalactose transaminase